MNDQILKKLLEYLQSTENLVVENAPEVAQQILRYEKIFAFATASLMTVLLAISLFIGFYFWKNPSIDKYGSRDTISVIGVFLPCAMAPLFFTTLCCSVASLVELYVAPKYFLIQLLLKMSK